LPFLDAYIPEGALTPDAERELVATITDLLIEHEGVDLANENGQKLAWVFVHRPQVYVAGARTRSPRYRFICQVPEGQYTDERRAAMTAGITRAVGEAESGAWPHPELRVGVFTLEIPDGTWGGGGRIIRLPDIYELLWPLEPSMGGEPRETAERVLAERRRASAAKIPAAPPGERSRPKTIDAQGST
jgi:phenylpyruvate tautomerase PptA (4-oxalocrotonate tautomerase family)